MFGEGALNRWTLPVIVRYGYLITAEQDKKLIALLTAIVKDKKAFLIGLWVRQDYQNQGVGNKIVAYLLNLLKDEGYESAELTADPNNMAAIALYQRLGFKKIDRLEDFYGPGNSRILLKCNLIQ